MHRDGCSLWGWGERFAIAPQRPMEGMAAVGDRAAIALDAAGARGAMRRAVRGPRRLALVARLVGARPQPSDRRTAHGGRWAVGGG